MELKIDKKTAVRLYDDSPEWFKADLIEKFGEECFSKKRFDEIKTFADACKEFGTTEEEFNQCFSNHGYDIDTINYEKLKIVVKAINQGWVPDFNNPDQYKYWPYFNLSSGFGFRASDYDCTDTVTSVGSRLCTNSSEKALYIAEQFKQEYIDDFLYPEKQ